MRALFLGVVFVVSGCSATTARSSGAPPAAPIGCCCLVIAGPADDCRAGFTPEDCDKQGEFQGQKVRWTAGKCP